jgi:hypothetical protein
MPWDSPSIPHFYKPITAYYPNDPWDVITYDAWGKRIDPIIPEGAVIPWWRQPKDQWPYISPWEPKIFGAFPPFWFKMREDIGAPVTDPPGPWPSPEIWPTVTFPKPAGLMHVNTRPDRPGPGLGPKVPIGTMKVHMRPTEWLEVTPHPSEWAAGKFQEAMRVMSRRRPIRIINEDGSSITLKGVRSAPWTQHKKEYDKLKAERTRNFK